MCSSILAIEFDQEKFDTDLKCTQWLRASQDYSILQAFKGFKLKQVARSIFMSEEGRKVFAWHGNLYQFKNLEVKRPATGVVALHRAASTEQYSTADYPPLSERALNRQRARRQNQEAKDKEKMERTIAQRIKRKRAKEEKKALNGKSVLKEDALLVKEKPIKRKAKKSKKTSDAEGTFAEAILKADKQSRQEAIIKQDDWTKPLHDVPDPTLVGSVFDSDFASRVDSIK